MKKLIILLLLMMLLLSACGMPGLTPAMDYHATIVALEVKVKLAEQNAQATADAIAAQPSPTFTCPTAVPCQPTPVCPALIVTETPQPTQNKVADPTEAHTGKISGRLAYPSEHIPAQRVVAFNIKTGYYYWQNTNDGMGNYSFDKLPVGVYHVMSYLISDPATLMAGYTQAVRCGLNVECTDHSLVDVEVKEGQTAADVDPIDWYADPVQSGWPADPTQKK